MDNIELNRFWGKVKEELIGSLPESVHTWVYSLEVSGFDNDILTVVTGQSMAREWLYKNHGAQINSVIQKITQNPDAHINIIYDEGAAKKIKKETEKIHKKELEAKMKEQAKENLSRMQSSANLNLKYKFENFVVGDNNKFAHSAALAVAQNPAKKYNPLFIYGNSGLGKTHLMQAIGHYTIFKNPKLTVKYTKTDDYINDFVSNCRNSNNTVENMSKFSKKYTNIDIILIDDIQFIESKGKTMDSFQHTFDTLYQKGKQIVITSDRVPEDIPKLTNALVTRFQSGLMVELLPPDFETRLQILQKIAQDNDIKPDSAALEYIADNFSKNVRELEGAFTKVCAYAEFNNKPVTLDLAKEVLKCKEIEKTLTFDKIADVVSKYYNVDLADIIGTARSQKIITARQMSIYLSRILTNQSFENIGEYFNRRHTTAMYSYNEIKKNADSDRNISSAIREIKQALKLI